MHVGIVETRFVLKGDHRKNKGFLGNSTGGICDKSASRILFAKAPHLLSSTGHQIREKLFLRGNVARVGVIVRVVMVGLRPPLSQCYREMFTSFHI